MNSKTQRIWLPDFIRGIAIILMVAFHLVFDLNYFYGWTQLKYYEGFWFYEGRLAALLFMLMLGVVSAIIFKIKESGTAIKSSLKRGLKLIGIGMGITLITWLAFPNEAVWFGILHLMGVSVILSIPLARFGWLNIILGGGIIFLGNFVEALRVQTMFLLPLGIRSYDFASLDYYPLIPWFGVVLIGIGLGNLLYKKFVQFGPPRSWQQGSIDLRKNSLWIYLIHLPLIYGLLWLVLG